MRDRLRVTFYSAVVAVTDFLPPRIRYGYVHRLTKKTFAGPLPSVPRLMARNLEATAVPILSADSIACALLADHLDIGGIGSVIEMLATNLAHEGIRPVVVCPGDGLRAQRLRVLGIEVVSAENSLQAALALASADLDAIQLHSAPDYLEKAAQASGLPLITVMHNTEIHYTPAKWRTYRELMARSFSGVAVSETVRAFHARRLPGSLANRLVVVPNGAPGLTPASAEDRRRARAALEEAIGTSLGDDIVFTCLARYDSQKNVAGLVAGFAAAAAKREDIRLVLAGDPSDWAELRRGQAIARLATVQDRVAFLGNSDASTLLTAADAFVLDSFFEGWPVAATEAAGAGLPLLLSEMGGARELIKRDPGRSYLVQNPAGDASGISDRSVRRARRRALHQANATEFADAILSLASRLRSTDFPPAQSVPSTIAQMVEEHAAIIRTAVESARQPD